MKRYLPALAAAVILAALVPWAGGQAGGGGTAATGPSPEKLEALATANQGSLVLVEYQLQYDKGDAPEGGGFAERCPFCGQFHGIGGFEEYISEERPLERPGVLVDATHVVTNDLQVHPRFIKGLRVRPLGGDAKSGPFVSAAISGYPKRQNALILEMSGPLAGVKPAAFDARRAGPYTVINVADTEGLWSVGLQSMPQDLILLGGKSYHSASRGLVVDKEGGPVGMTSGQEVPVDGSWKGSPMSWEAYSGAAMKDLLGKVEGRVTKGLVPVTLNFRSPKTTGVRERFSMENEEATVQHVMGVFTDSRTVLVLANLKSSTTARLERIRVLTDPPVEAKFKATLTDYGAFVAQTDAQVAGGPGLSGADLHALRGEALPAAEILLQGETRVTYFQHRRLAGLSLGFRGNLYPQVASGENVYLFDPAGDLLALPVQQRDKAGGESRYSYSRAILTSVAPLRKVLADLGANTDPNNVPLSEDQEGRVAWLGFELQTMTKDLARANNVADQTKDGETGGLVTFVYPDSPAAKAGVEPGWVLLRLDIQGQPKPMDVEVESEPFSGEPFPWDRFDEIPETVFDRIPTPWPSAENALMRALTDIGFGKTFTAEFYHDRKLDKKEFTIAQGPPTFATAPKYKHVGLGLTVKDLTYEVRRYMQKKEGEPGVIIGKIELGSKASLAGLKPFEVVTHVNDKPVLNVKDFEAAAKDLTELRLSIKRMTAGRIVNVSLPAAGTQTQPR